MSNTKRTDIHSPSHLIPADYSYVLAYAGAGSDGEPAYNMDLLLELLRSQALLPQAQRQGWL